MCVRLYKVLVSQAAACFFCVVLFSKDQSEQFHIKHLCLSTILELLLTCKMYPRIGDRTGRFLHVPRTATLQANTIGYARAICHQGVL